MKRSIKTIFTAALVLGLSSGVLAQNSDNDNISASADVIAALSVTGDNDLTFGDVSPGVNKSVAPDAATAGLFTVSGGADASVELQFSTLPSTLSDGTNTLPISYTANYGDSYNAANDFTPSEGAAFSGSPTIPTDGDMNVYLGGQVTPAGTQAAGNYSATITLTATYN